MFLGTSKLPEQANTGREGRYLDAGKLCTGHELARSNCYLVSARASKTCTRGYFLVTFEKIHIVYGSLPGRVRGRRKTCSALNRSCMIFKPIPRGAGKLAVARLTGAFVCYTTKYRYPDSGSRNDEESGMMVRKFLFMIHSTRVSVASIKPSSERQDLKV